MQAGKRIRPIVLVAVILAALVYVFKVPETFVENTRKASVQVQELLQALTRTREQLVAYQADARAWHVLAPVEASEGWQADLVLIAEEARTAQVFLEQEALPVVHWRKPVTSAIVRELDNTLMYLKAAQDQLGYINRRMSVLLTVYQDRQRLHDEALQSAQQVEHAWRAIYKRLSRAARHHPLRGPEIDSFGEELSGKRTLISTLARNIDDELGKPDPDYGDYLADYERLTFVARDFHKRLAQIDSEIASLDRLQIRILLDQRTRREARVIRMSWCGDQPCAEHPLYQYAPVVLDEQAYLYLKNQEQMPLADEEGEKLIIRIDSGHWKALGVDRFRDRPPGQTRAEYRVRLSEQHEHRYGWLNDTQFEETDWRPVKRNFYLRHYEHLGMAIYTKPRGWFESDAVKVAEPPGLVLVESPSKDGWQGSKKNEYGMWHQEPDGQLWWAFNDQYAALTRLIPGGRYSFATWLDYAKADYSQPGLSPASPRQGLTSPYRYDFGFTGLRHDYYGDRHQFGTRGLLTYSVPAFRYSQFGRESPQMVKDALAGTARRVSYPVSHAVYSVRGAGPSSRGYGPSGSGK